jgi:hypothetical protein
MSPSNIYKLFDTTAEGKEAVVVSPDNQINSDSLSSLDPLTMAASAIFEQSKDKRR